jgi:beta-lactamase regulating signal transducer with metallopeptidase domain
MNANVFLPVLLELLLKSFLILAAATLLHRTLRQTSAAHQHLIWAASFAALLVLPFTKLLSPHWKLRAPQSSNALPTIAPVAETGSAILDELIPASEPATSRPRFALPSASQAFASVWLGGCILLIGYRILGSIQLWRLKHQAWPINDSRLTDAIRAVRKETGVRRDVDLLATNESSVPFTFGTWRPTLILPASCEQWTDDQLFAVLRHELGHIARHDYLARLIAETAVAIYWLNPLAWLGIRSLRKLQEQACDDLVLNSGTRASIYATLLVETARLLRIPRYAVAMARPSTLEDRVIAIVDAARRREPVGNGARLIALPFIAIALGGSALAQYEAVQPVNPSAGVETRNAGTDLRTKIKSITIPKIQFRDASLREIAEYLVKRSRELDPDGKGMNIILRTDATNHKGLTYSGQDLPLIEVLRHVTAHFNLAFRIEQFAVAIVPQEELQVISVKEYQLPAGFIPDAELKTERSPVAKADVSAYLAKLGVSHQSSPPTVAVYTPASHRLMMRNTLANHDLLSALIDDYAARNPGKSAGAASREMTLVERKLNSIVLPKLQYHEAAPRECLEHLETISARFDPEKTGVKFTVRLPEETPDARITLSVQNIPLIEALRFVTSLGNLGYRITENEVLVAPIGDPSLKTFIRREYRLPKSASTPDGQIQATNGVRYSSATEFLQASGVEFPEGTTAALTENGTRLVIRNTPENIAITESIVAALMEADRKGNSDKRENTDKPARKDFKGTDAWRPAGNPRTVTWYDSLPNEREQPLFAIAINTKLQRKKTDERKPGAVPVQSAEPKSLRDGIDYRIHKGMGRTSSVELPSQLF